jgi:serine/threonine-protein kinase
MAEDDSESTTDERGDRASARDLSRPARLTGARYELDEELGHGGMGEVIAARDGQIGRGVAIKRMRAKDPTPRQVARFMREARIQGRLEHPSIVPVHELGRDVDGRPYFAMKRLAGRTLAEMLAAAPAERAPRQRLLRAFVDVCMAAEFAHTRGVVHRDLKPENIMLGDFGEVYVLDWGVAKLLAADAADAADTEDTASRDSDTRLVTRVGAAIGTPGYMSPEQARGDATIDARSDVFALGTVLAEILAVDGDVPPELDALCTFARRGAAAERLATARELGDGVQRYLDGDRDLALRRELARTHYAAATAAFARGGVADHATAIREAGRALALDPKLAGAAELVTRLMLEPPREIPPEVEVALASDAETAKIMNVAISRWAQLGYLALLGALAASGELVWTFALAVPMAVAQASLWWVRPGRATPPLILFLAGNVGLIAVLAHVYSPVLLAPCSAALTGLMFALVPPDAWFLRAPGLIAILCTAALAPALAEVLGLLSPTMRVDAAGLHLFGPGLLDGPMLTIGLTALAPVAYIAIGVLIGRGLRLAERQARRALHLQAWQLRQLVS